MSSHEQKAIPHFPNYSLFFFNIDPSWFLCCGCFFGSCFCTKGHGYRNLEILSHVTKVVTHITLYMTKIRSQRIWYFVMHVRFTFSHTRFAINGLMDKKVTSIMMQEHPAPRRQKIADWLTVKQEHDKTPGVDGQVIKIGCCFLLINVCFFLFQNNLSY